MANSAQAVEGCEGTNYYYYYLFVNTLKTAVDVGMECGEMENQMVKRSVYSRLMQKPSSNICIIINRLQSYLIA